MTTNLALDPTLRARLAQARDTAVAALLRERNPLGHWTGGLSASALSTATAITALTLIARSDPAAAARLGTPLRAGFTWLTKNQNADGGWGDTTKSFSNISTTTLVWAALGLIAEKTSSTGKAIAAAESWLARAAGSLEPRPLVRAIERRYGRDRTFSIPILTMCALCGRLGPGREGWRHVRQLPFELAALPQRWFGALQLPVVSYALPALIAIGQVRHGLRPTRNPLLRVLRDGIRARTLEKLSRLQPPNGGFLEATPLTSFVTMSLAALDHTAHPVVRRSAEFLEASQRPDGSWPIDTNLATWVTTLSVNALAPITLVDTAVGPPLVGEPSQSSSTSPNDPVTGADHVGERTALPSRELATLRDWLLRQQYRTTHPYTLAAPGGWAWTDLPGGVPDADDTAGAILALLRLAADNPAASAAVAAGVRWLRDLQNRDGGVPTFCRGWGKLPFDRSSPDITAHAIRAWSAARRHLAPASHAHVDRALGRAAKFLLKTQSPDGAWVPLWFGHQDDPSDENPLYGTARVIPALCVQDLFGRAEIRAALDRALRWLIAKQNPDGGWSGAPGAASSVEETGVAMEALAAAWERNTLAPAELAALRTAIARGGAWLAAAIETEAWRTPTPIGFYFAKLWYFERLYPLIFATGALTRLASLR